MRLLAWFTLLLCSGSQAQTLHGAGATFPAPLYRQWIASFQKSHPGTLIDYDETGSTAGIDRLLNRRADFAGSEVPLSDQQLKAASIRVVQIPTVIGAVAPIHNVQGEFRDLRFTPEILADIYLGKIRRWNDPAITAVNRGARLPAGEITVVHRADGSGTTWIWSSFLSEASAEWKMRAGAGTSLAWPVGIAAERNEGVADLVQRTPNSIGYVEAIYAILHRLNFGSVRNVAGKFVKADIDSISAAISTSAAPVGNLHSVPQRSMDPRSYPVSSFTWLLVPAENGDIQKQQLLVSFMKWVLTSGQRECSALGYVPLPEDVVRTGQSLLQTIR